MRTLVLISLFATAAAADPEPTAAQKAKAAVAGIAKDPESILMQSRFALNELSDIEYHLPKDVRKTLESMGEPDAGNHAKLIAAALDEEAKDFLKAACGTTKTADLLAMTNDKVIATCHLRDRKAVPSKLGPTLRPAALLFAAFLIDLLGKDATEDERELARWVAHYGRSDEDKAKGLAKP